MTMLRRRVVVSIAVVALGAVAVPVFASASSSGESDSVLALNELSCPATSQCTAIDGKGREVTFNPASPKHASRHRVTSYASSLSCPSTALCVAVNGLNPGHAVAFAPKSGRILKAFTLPNRNAGGIDGNNALACVSVNQCTAVTFDGELTFNPTTGKPISSNATLSSASEGYDDVVCTSAKACTTLFQDGTGVRQGEVVTFDPTSGVTKGSGATLVNGYGLETLACPSATECIAGDHSGDEVTFDPNTGQPKGAGQVTLWSRRAVEAMSCPSVSQCTARNGFGQDMTFNPRTGAKGRSHRLGPGEWIAIDCPSVAQCTVTGGHGNETTFNPAKGIGTIHTIDS